MTGVFMLSSRLNSDGSAVWAKAATALMKSAVRVCVNLLTGFLIAWLYETYFIFYFCRHEWCYVLLTYDAPLVTCDKG